MENTFLNKKLIIHADDFGITKGVTDNICSTFDNGFLNSVSIIPNGRAFIYAINKYKNRKTLNLSIHINLVEGEPILSPKEVSLIVSNNGMFNKSFFGIWLKYILSGIKQKELLKIQVKNEIRAQINKVLENCGSDYKVKIDSHQHYHMIPFIFKILCELNEEFEFSYIRIPSEKLFIVNKKYWINYLNINLIKNILLKLLSFNKRDILRKKGIFTNDHFLGILFSGKMSKSNVLSGLKNLKREKIVEILFHPGGAKESEKISWKDQPDLESFYYSKWRIKERELLLNKDFHKKINALGFI